MTYSINNESKIITILANKSVTFLDLAIIFEQLEAIVGAGKDQKLWTVNVLGEEKSPIIETITKGFTMPLGEIKEPSLVQEFEKNPKD